MLSGASRCPLTWVAALAAVALAAGCDRVYVVGLSAAATSALLAYAFGQVHAWLWWGNTALTALILACVAFYGVHCRPIALQRRREQLAKQKQ